MTVARTLGSLWAERAGDTITRGPCADGGRDKDKVFYRSFHTGMGSIIEIHLYIDFTSLNITSRVQRKEKDIYSQNLKLLCACRR